MTGPDDSLREGWDHLGRVFRVGDRVVHLLDRGYVGRVKSIAGYPRGQGEIYKVQVDWETMGNGLGSGFGSHAPENIALLNVVEAVSRLA